ncbi:MAG: formylmethanofuran dehydrogenase subunit C [Candidatus Hermodarchaeia archaeon]|jgi:formylmethanofuran dehydrogenase subunit C
MPATKLVFLPTFDSAEKIPLDLKLISPDTVAGKTADKIRKIKIWHGNKRTTVNKFFEVSGKTDKAAEKTVIEFTGAIPQVRHLGQDMTTGTIIVKGDVGMHLGVRRRGGIIEVIGNVDHWLGAEMSGGSIRVTGNVGDKAASSYLGSKYGMNGGNLHIMGNAGHELGMGMRRGIIVVEGNTASYTGTRMLAGTIIIRGQLGERAGAAMGYKGTIIALGKAKPPMPTHLFNGEYSDMVFLRLLMDAIETEIPGVTFTEKEKIGPYLRFTGDFGSGGRGELLFIKSANNHLKVGNNGS